MRRIFLAVTVTLALTCVAFLFTDISTPSTAQVRGDQQPREFPRADRGPGKRMADDKAGLRRLSEKTRGNARVSSSESTGAARFVNLTSRNGDLSGMGRTSNAREKSETFFREFGSIFGINNSGVELRFSEQKTDGQSEQHLTFKQFYGGVPVFAGVLKTHFDKAENLHTVNGTTVPLIDVDTQPAVAAQTAASLAVDFVAAQKAARNLRAKTTTLYVYRTGLVEGVPGDDHLAYEIEVTNGFDVREFVYVDAHSNKIVDQFTGIYDALNRRAYDGQGVNSEANYPNNPFWAEGQQPFPTGNVEADNVIFASKETYDFFKNTFNRDSFGGTGETMHSIFNWGPCGNAYWNGTAGVFCSGWATDDIAAHEWGHAYTERTHGLIYAYQPGALNESYSDIWGETIDRLNDRDVVGNSGTDAARSDTQYCKGDVELYINLPEVLAGTYAARYAAFGPLLSSTGPVTSDVVVALDEANGSGPSTTDGCTALTNAATMSGKIALLDRGACTFVQKVYNAQTAGAVGVLVANNVATGLPNLSGATNAELVTIPSIGITQAAGNGIKAELSSGPVNATMRDVLTGDSTRWLVGEDINPGGSIRDMWSPACHGQPGKVADVEYACGSEDQGGVHSNSGIPNHAYALLVEGGTYNGQTIGMIGLTKAAHLYFRAMNVYQVSNSNFADHADSIEQSAADLLAGGAILADLKTGLPSGQIFTQSDVDQVKKAMVAVQMRRPPTQCGINPILDKNTPPEPAYTAGKVSIFSETFETGASGWEMSRTMTSGNASEREWGFVDNSTTTRLPARLGTAAYVADPDYICSETAIDESGVLHLASPVIQIPANVVGARMSFEHRFASELDHDGGQLMVSVGGMPFTLVPASAFVFNPYNETLTGAALSTNPRAGQTAFSGTDDTQRQIEASWGTSIISLDGIASPGQSVRFRWDFSNDKCRGAWYYGWFVDNVKVYGGLIDTDADGVTDSADQCAGTILTDTVVIGTGAFSQTGVRNHLLATGCTFQQLITAAKAGARNRGIYVDRVSSLTDQWVAAGLINGAEKDALMRAVANDR